MTLKDYLETADKTLSEFAREVGVGRGTIHNLVSGRRKPSASLVFKIEKATSGKVRLSDFYE